MGCVGVGMLGCVHFIFTSSLICVYQLFANFVDSDYCFCFYYVFTT
jgi:hypothetical protein